MHAFGVFITWVKLHKELGFLLLAGLTVISTICFLPVLVFCIGSGYAFTYALGSAWEAVLVGTASCWIGGTTGAMIAFWLGRYVFRDCVEEKLRTHETLSALDQVIQEKGLRIMLILRLSPILPSNVLNYITGATKLSSWHYFISSFSMIPSKMMYVYIGTVISNLNDITDAKIIGHHNRAVELIVMAFCIVFTVLAFVWTTIYSYREVQKIKNKGLVPNDGERPTVPISEFEHEP